MKHIKAIIRPHKLGNVLGVLKTLPHFSGVTVYDGEGYGHGTGKGGEFRPSGELAGFKSRAKVIDVFCPAEECDEIVKLIQRAARSGKRGDGIIVVSDLCRTVRIASESKDE